MDFDPEKEGSMLLPMLPKLAEMNEEQRKGFYTLDKVDLGLNSKEDSHLDNKGGFIHSNTFSWVKSNKLQSMKLHHDPKQVKCKTLFELDNPKAEFVAMNVVMDSHLLCALYRSPIEIEEEKEELDTLDMLKGDCSAVEAFIVAHEMSCDGGQHYIF